MSRERWSQNESKIVEPKLQKKLFGLSLTHYQYCPYWNITNFIKFMHDYNSIPLKHEVFI